MRLHTRLLINNRPVTLDSYLVSLALFSAGRGFFSLSSETAPSGLVTFFAGYDANQLTSYFSGFIERADSTGKNHYRITCREFHYILRFPLDIIQRNTTMVALLNNVARERELSINTPDQNYTRQSVGRFYSVGTGFYLLSSLPKVFNYTRPICTQLLDGGLYVGSWHDCELADGHVDIPAQWNSQSGLDGGRTLGFIETIRPGRQVNGKIVTSVEFKKTMMTLQTQRNPWVELR